MMASSFEVYLYFLIGVVSCSTVNDYYLKLITQETEKAVTYVLPKSNEDFKEGIESDAINDYGEFDVVIVGAGSAGSVVATRLSEIDEINILLIEAGGEATDFNLMIQLWTYLQFSEQNWGYFTTPQKHSCLGMNNKQCIIARGKVVGGSSSINGAIYVRGHSDDYDQWARLGNRGWSYKDVFPYFKKSENSQVQGDKGYHGKGGFWNTEHSLPPSSLLENFIKATLEAKQSFIDYNGKNQIGSSQVQFSLKQGKRQSLGTAFLDNARKRSNLEVVTKALVTKILIDPRSKTATGVEFVTKNKKFQVRAKREVILSAGSINTPQILMLSGIGPRQHLREMKIPLIADLPVGENLMEHSAFNLIIRTNSTIPTLSMEQSVDLYLNGGFGPLTKGANADGISFIHTKNSSAEAPSIQLVFAATPGIQPSVDQRVLNFNDNVSERFLKQINPQTDILIYVILLHGKSRGRIFLNTSSPMDFPHIDLNMLGEQEDVDTMIDGVEYVINLLNTEAFRKINATVLEISLCTQFKNNTKKRWECLIRQLAANGYHPCGTAAMGPDSKKFVVDDNLRVHGFKNLRVVDASIFPLIVSGNSNAAAVMVAEKAADLIKTTLVHY